MTECFDNFIDGESAPGASTRPNINPSDTTDVVGDFACASMSDCERAIAAAANAKYGWARSPIQNRYEVLKTASDEILDRREELGQLLAREEGKTLPEGIGEAFARIATRLAKASPTRRTTSLQCRTQCWELLEIEFGPRTNAHRGHSVAQS